MVSRIFVLCVVFVCGLSYTDAAMSIRKTENTKKPGYYLIGLECTVPDVDSNAQDINIIQILKEQTGRKKMMIASIGRDGKVTYGHSMEKDFEGNGVIDHKDKEDSFLYMELLNPKATDEGQYVCDIYYNDISGQQQHTSSSVTLKLHEMILKVDTDVSDQLKKLEEQINDLKLKLKAQEKKCEQKIEENANNQTSVITNVVKKYNNQLNSIVKTMNDKETAMNELIENLNDSLGDDVDREIAELNETIAELKANLDEGQGQLESRLKDDLAKHVQVFENVTKDLAKKDAVSEIESRVSKTEPVVENLAQKISLVSDKVDIIEFLIQPSASSGPLKASITQLTSNLNTLKERADNQTQEISDLRKEMTETDVTAFSATFSKTKVAVLNEILVFDEVILNKGQGYNNTTGVFTAPRSGIYAFNLVLLTRIQQKWIDVDLMADKTLLIRLTSHGSPKEDQNAVSVVTPLQAGQEVMTRIMYTAPNGVNKIPNLNFSVFSGYFLHPL